MEFTQSLIQISNDQPRTPEMKFFTALPNSILPPHPKNPHLMNHFTLRGVPSETSPNKLKRKEIDSQESCQLKSRRIEPSKAKAKEIYACHRIVLVRFGSTAFIKAKKLLQEPWGLMVSMLEVNEELNIKEGARYWAKWDGTICPYSSMPVVEAVHPC